MALFDSLHPTVLNALARQAANPYQAAQPGQAAFTSSPFTAVDQNAPRSLQGASPSTPRLVATPGGGVAAFSDQAPPSGWLGSFGTPTVVGGKTITHNPDGSTTIRDNATGISSTTAAGDAPPSPSDPAAYNAYVQTYQQLAKNAFSPGTREYNILHNQWVAAGSPQNTLYNLPTLRTGAKPDATHDPPVILSAAPPSVVTPKGKAKPKGGGYGPPPPYTPEPPVVKIVPPKTIVIKAGKPVTLKAANPLAGYTSKDYLKFIAPDQKNLAAVQKILSNMKLPNLNKLRPAARAQALADVKAQVLSIRASQLQDRAAGTRQAKFARQDAATQARIARQDAATQASTSRQDAATQALYARQDASTQAAADTLDAHNQAAAVFAAGRAAAQLFQGMAPGVADVYQQAAQNTEQAAAGFTGSMQGQAQAEGQTVADLVNRATGGSYTPTTPGGVNVQTMPSGVANAQYLSQGYVPGTTLAQEAARQYANATLNIPRQFTGEAGLQGASTLAAGSLAAAKARAAGGVASARALQAGGVASQRELAAGGLASQRALQAGGVASQRALGAGETAAENLNASIQNAWAKLPSLTQSYWTSLANNSRDNFNAAYKLAQGNVGFASQQLTNDQKLWFQMAGLNVQGAKAANTFIVDKAKIAETFRQHNLTYYHQVNQDAVATFNAGTNRMKAVNAGTAAAAAAGDAAIKHRTALVTANTAQLKSKIAWYNVQHPQSKVKESQIAAWVNRFINQGTAKGGQGQTGEIYTGTVITDLEKAAHAIVNEFPGFFGDGSPDPNVQLSDAMRYLVGAQKQVPYDPHTQQPDIVIGSDGKPVKDANGQPIKNTFEYQYGAILAAANAPPPNTTTPYG